MRRHIKRVVRPISCEGAEWSKFDRKSRHDYRHIYIILVQYGWGDHRVNVLMRLSGIRLVPFDHDTRCSLFPEYIFKRVDRSYGIV